MLSQVEMLRESEFKYRSILEELDLGYMEVDLEGTVMGMYAKRDIKKGEPLLSDYDNDYGVPPDWIARFAKDHLDSKIVFAGMNHNSAGFSSIGGA